jgi:hypothetical protein
MNMCPAPHKALVSSSTINTRVKWTLWIRASTKMVLTTWFVAMGACFKADLVPNTIKPTTDYPLPAAQVCAHKHVGCLIVIVVRSVARLALVKLLQVGVIIGGLVHGKHVTILLVLLLHDFTHGINHMFAQLRAQTLHPRRKNITQKVENGKEVPG